MAQIARGGPWAVVWIRHHDDSKIAAPVVRRVDERDPTTERAHGNRGPSGELNRRPAFELEANLSPGRDQSRVVAIDVKRNRAVLGGRHQDGEQLASAYLLTAQAADDFDDRALDGRTDDLVLLPCDVHFQA